MLKNLICTLLFSAVIVTFTANAQSTNDNALIGKANGAAATCLSQYRNYSLITDISTIGACTKEGLLKRVTFSYLLIATRPCDPETGICYPIDYAYEVVAYVDFDCYGNVIYSSCE